jgi:hypothetical protein
MMRRSIGLRSRHGADTDHSVGEHAAKRRPPQMGIHALWNRVPALHQRAALKASGSLLEPLRPARTASTGRAGPHDTGPAWSS